MTIADATALVGHSQGLPEDFDGSTAAVNALSPEQKLPLTAGVLAYVRGHPELFTAAQVAVANSDTSRQGSYAGGISPTVTISDLADAVGSAAKDVVIDPLAKVGSGVSNTIALLGSVLPLIVLGAVLFLAWQWTKRAAPAAS